MNFYFSVIFLLLIVSSQTSLARPYDLHDAIVEERPSETYKRATDYQQEMVMARLQQLLGPESFAELDSHGRLSNLQRLG